MRFSERSVTQKLTGNFGLEIYANCTVKTSLSVRPYLFLLQDVVLHGRYSVIQGENDHSFITVISVVPFKSRVCRWEAKAS